MVELQFRATAAAGYDQSVGLMTLRYVPALLRGAGIAPGQKVLDVATGTGIAAEAVAAAIGPSGRIIAADISPAMVERARERLTKLTNITFAVENGQALTFADASFDSVICNMGLMYFPDPARGLSEFHRVLRPGRRSAVSVLTAPEHSALARVLVIIARHVPTRTVEAQQQFALGNEQRLRSLFQEAGFREIQTNAETFHFTYPSFDAFFGGVERGAGSVGQEYMALPEDLRHLVREETRREVCDQGGTIEVDVKVTYGSGQR
jgi:ubiquinone/menaquinone biosynthesis C-methylase UbiE